MPESSDNDSKNVTAQPVLLPCADLAQAPVDPQLGELLLNPVLGEPRAEIAPIHVIERLVLIEAGEHHRLFARARILVELETLRANLLHHALHGRIDAADGLVIGLQIRGESGVPRPSDRAHHRVRADHHQAVHRVQRDFRFVQQAATVAQPPPRPHRRRIRRTPNTHPLVGRTHPAVPVPATVTARPQETSTQLSDRESRLDGARSLPATA